MDVRRAVRHTWLFMMLSATVVTIGLSCWLILWPMWKDYREVQRLLEPVKDVITARDVYEIRELIRATPDIDHRIVYLLSEDDGRIEVIMHGIFSGPMTAEGDDAVVKKLDGVWTIIEKGRWES